MRIIFMGKDKSLVIDALKHLMNLGVEVVAVIAPIHNEQSHSNPKLCDVAKSFQLPVCSDIDIYKHLAGTKIINLNLKNIDVVISFFSRKE